MEQSRCLSGAAHPFSAREVLRAQGHRVFHAGRRRDGTIGSQLDGGLLVGPVYRFRVTGIPFSPGVELYPTIELLGRLHPPAGHETRFPIPITLNETDLQNAMDGSLVTRVIYLEDPQSATPLAKTNDDPTPIDLTPDQDALATADSLGRPIAILRIGSLAPPRNPALTPQFYFGYPTWAPIYQSEPPIPAPTETTTAQAN